MTATVLTTGRAARLCQVSQRTVCKWCDLGLLPHWRLPGSEDRRILKSVLIGFMRTHGMPMDAFALTDPDVMASTSIAKPTAEVAA